MQITGKTRGAAGWIRVRDELKRFVSVSGTNCPRRAIICTYDFDGDIFAREVLSVLQRRGREFHVLVLADRGAFQARPRPSGARYNLSLVKMDRGIFHPKLIYLSCGEDGLVAIGSGNMTRYGMGTNLELISFHRQDGRNNQSMVNAARSFLESLRQSRRIDLDSSSRQFLQQVTGTLHKAERNQNACMHRAGLLSSLKEPLINQMQRCIGKQTVAKIRAVSPFYAGGHISEYGFEVKAIERLGKLFGAEVQLYTDVEELPKLLPVPHVLGEHSLSSSNDPDNTGPHSEYEQMTRLPTRLHAKAYMFEMSDGSAHLFHGSANLTLPGLFSLRTNVELLVHTELSQNEAQTFVAELNERFQRKAKVTHLVPQPSRPFYGRGNVVGGTLHMQRSRTVALKLELNENRRQVTIAQQQNGGPVHKVFTKQRCGWVRNPKILCRLKLDAIGAEAGSWTAVLWEVLSGGRRVPFTVNLPVSWPARLLEEATGADWLEQLVSEERGVWPTRNVGQDTAGEEEPEEEEEQLDCLPEGEDKESLELAAVCHQGELDRVAVRSSVLLRQILHSRKSSENCLDSLAELRRSVRKRLNGVQRGSVLGWISEAEERARKK